VEVCGVEKSLNLSGRHRPTEEVSLHHIATQPAKYAHLVLRFHAFGDAGELQVAAHVDHGLDDRSAVGIRVGDAARLAAARNFHGAFSLLRKPVHGPELLERLNALAARRP